MTGIFSISILRPGAPEHTVKLKEGRGRAWGVDVALDHDGENLTLRLNGHGEVIATVWLQPGFTDPFPLLPGFIIGYNRPDDTGPYYPQMTPRTDLDPPAMQSPFWGIRADRATVPAVFMFGSEGMRAMAIPPYIDDPGHPHTVNGLRVCLKRGIGVSIGFTVEPVQYVHRGTTAPGYRGYHRLDGETRVTCRRFESTSADRRGHAVVIRSLYARDHQEAPSGEGMHATVKMLADAMWQDVLKPAQNELAGEMKGELFKIKDWQPGRLVWEIGWTGGAMAAYPFLRMQPRCSRPELAAYAVNRLDRIAAGINPASGLFWDCEHAGQYHSRGWWTGLEPEAHYSYTNGHACYYLLKAADLVPDHADAWRAAARTVLERVLTLQQPDGQFPVSFALTNGEPLHITGFAGCWFAAALAHLYEITQEKHFLDAAVRAVQSYHGDVAALVPCGTPMDTHNATDQEGNLALLHATAKLHRLTGSGEFLAMLRDSADFEMLWRYYYNVRAPYSPLDTADWGSSGGSVTSAHNPHIHPMHLNALDQVLHLADTIGDAYYLERTRDAVRYGCCCVCRPEEDFGWGRPGWLCERFCPSDGLIIQHNLRTGEPWSAGCDYHVWTTAVTLEGFTGPVWERFPDLMRNAELP